ncbi:MAG TPA: hypothetical protein VFW52_01440 [Candidatus Saccharimonadales bacterium]|nr:hypothetical protein [Candidatus Saccharimonadales bacterium]
MGVVVKQQPHLTDLHRLIDAVPRYPVSVRQLVELGHKKRSPDAAIDFYKKFPADEVFEDKDDLLSRTESIDILRHQSAPREEMRAPEED